MLPKFLRFLLPVPMVLYFSKPKPQAAPAPAPPAAPAPPPAPDAAQDSARTTFLQNKPKFGRSSTILSPRQNPQKAPILGTALKF